MTIRDKIRLIKYSRLSKVDKYLLKLTDGLEIQKQNMYPNSIFWKKDGVLVFEEDYNINCLRVTEKILDGICLIIDKNISTTDLYSLITNFNIRYGIFKQGIEANHELYFREVRLNNMKLMK